LSRGKKYFNACALFEKFSSFSLLLVLSFSKGLLTEREKGMYSRPPTKFRLLMLSVNLELSMMTDSPKQYY